MNIRPHVENAMHQFPTCGELPKRLFTLKLK